MNNQLDEIKQQAVALNYEDVKMHIEFSADIIVENKIIIEINRWRFVILGPRSGFALCQTNLGFT